MSDMISVLLLCTCAFQELAAQRLLEVSGISIFAEPGFFDSPDIVQGYMLRRFRNMYRTQVHLHLLYMRPVCNMEDRINC